MPTFDPKFKKDLFAFELPTHSSYSLELPTHSQPNQSSYSLELPTHSKRIRAPSPLQLFLVPRGSLDAILDVIPSASLAANRRYRSLELCLYTLPAHRDLCLNTPS